MLTMRTKCKGHVLAMLPALVALLLASCGRSQSGKQTTSVSSPAIAAPSVSPSAAPPITSTPPPLGTDIVDAQLVTPQAGWALTKASLNWTSDGGATWRPLQLPIPSDAASPPYTS